MKIFLTGRVLEMRGKREMGRMSTPYIFDIGFSKCGTTSLSKALEVLGCPTVHYKYRLIEDGHHVTVRLVDVIRNNLEMGKQPFYGIDHIYRGFCDFSGPRFYRVLDQHYPGSKFILTVRDIDSLVESRRKHVLRKERTPKFAGKKFNINIGRWHRIYEQYFDEITEYFRDRPEDFLIMNIVNGDGWEKLCPFIGAEVPNGNFPVKNRAVDRG